METIITILHLQTTLLLLIVVGAGGRKLGVITQGFSDGLSKFLMNIVLPCSILSSFQANLNETIWRQSMQILLITVAVHLFYILLGTVLYRRGDPDQQAVLRFAILCPNTNFMGMPVIGGIYGDAGILLLSIALLPARCFIMTVGISYFLTGNPLVRLKSLLSNPSFWAVFAGVTMMSFHWRLWEPLARAISCLGSCNTPLAMVLIGTVVASLTREMLADLRVWEFCALRLVLIPLAVALALRLAGTEGTVAGVAVTMSALPAGAMTVIFSKAYHRDESYGAACVIVSTLVSAATVPLINAVLLALSG